MLLDHVVHKLESAKGSVVELLNHPILCDILIQVVCLVDAWNHKWFIFPILDEYKAQGLLPTHPNFIASPISGGHIVTLHNGNILILINCFFTSIPVGYNTERLFHTMSLATKKYKRKLGTLLGGSNHIYFLSGTINH